VPGPEELLHADALGALHGSLVGDYFQRLGTDQMDTRFVQGPPPLRLAQGDVEPRHQVWVRPLGLEPMSPKEVGCCLAYLSDVTVLATPMLSIGRLGDGVTDFASSFDHSLRFYSGLEEIPWIIYDQRGAAVAGLTLEAHGRMATRDGRLVGTVTQQGVLMLLPGED
jgi:acyl-CoA thioesterase-2